MKWIKNWPRSEKGEINNAYGLMVNLLITIFVVSLMLLGAPAIMATVDNMHTATEELSIQNALDRLQGSGIIIAYADPSGTLYVNDVFPELGSTYKLGASGTKFSEGHFDNLYAPTGRSTMYFVAASDATAAEKAQANYICSGSWDNEVIQPILDSGEVHIVLSSGNFFGKLILLGEGDAIVGQGIELTKFTLQSGSNTDLISYETSGGPNYFPYIGYLELYGNRANNSSGRGVVSGDATNYWQDLRMESVFVDAFPDTGIFIWSAWGFIIDNVIVENCGGYGIHSESTGSSLKISNSKIISNDDIALFLESKDSMIINSEFSANSTACIYIIGSDAVDNKIIGNRIRPIGTGTAGVQVTTLAARTTIIGNDIKGVSGAGSAIIFQAGELGGNIAIGNDITGCQYSVRNQSGREDNIALGNWGAMTSSLIFSGETITMRKLINYDDASPLALCNVYDGYAITDIWVEVVTTWNGAGAALSIGDGDNNSGYMTSGNMTLTSAGYYGLNYDQRGVYIWDSTNNHGITKVYTGSDTIDAFITPGTGATQGKAVAYIKLTRLNE